MEMSAGGAEMVAGKSSRARHNKVPSALGRRKARSRITNGNQLLPGIDGRSPVARRYRDIMAALLVDQGGADRCSESRKQLIRRFAAASVLAEMLEARLARGETMDLQEHALLSSTLVRLAQRIGIEREQKVITGTAEGKTLGDLLAEDLRRQRREAAEAQERVVSSAGVAMAVVSLRPR